jgi:hypothetical protein
MGMIHSATRETSHFTFISVPLTPTSCHNGQMAKRVIRDRVNRHVAPKAMLIMGGYRHVEGEKLALITELFLYLCGTALLRVQKQKRRR